MLLGIGLGIESNVSGVILAFYGLALGALFAAVATMIAHRRR